MFYCTMNSASLQDLPPELVGEVICLLTLPDLKNVRLLCRRLNGIVKERIFCSYFKQRTIPLTVKGLLCFLDYLHLCSLASWIEIITIEAVMPEDTAPRNVIASLLLNIFIQLTRITSTLRSLSITTVHTSSRCLSPMLRAEHYSNAACSQSAFDAVMNGLQQSNLKLSRLDVWSVQPSDAPAMDIFRLYKDKWSVVTFENLKALSICLTTHPHQRTADLSRDHDPIAISMQNIQGTIHFMSLLQSLQELSIHWRRRKPIEDTREAQFFQACYRLLSGLPLKKFALHGAHVNCDAIRNFMKATSARYVTLKGIYLYHGLWKDVFDILTRSQDSFKFYQLEDLRECDSEDPEMREWNESMIFYKMPGLPKFTMQGGTIRSPTTITRKGPDVLLPLGYFPWQGRMTGSGQSQSWSMREVYLYGMDETIHNFD